MLTKTFSCAAVARLSVCDRATNYHKITAREKVCLQAKLMAYGLAIKDGRTFFPENSSGGRLSFQTNPDIDAYVNDAYNSIRFDDSMKGKDCFRQCRCFFRCNIYDDIFQ